MFDPSGASMAFSLRPVVAIAPELMMVFRTLFARMALMIALMLPVGVMIIDSLPLMLCVPVSGPLMMVGLACVGCGHGITDVKRLADFSAC